MSDILLDGLNPEQREAVTLPDESALVLAGAGSGKTRVLTSRIAWLIREGRATPESIMAVTFTNKASREMLSRIENQMRISTRGMWVGTFHGLCNRMLRIHAEEAGLPPGFQIIDQADQLSAVKRVMKTAGVDKETIEPKTVQNYINSHKEAGIRAAGASVTDLGGPAGEIALQLYRAYEKLCLDEGIVDFAELMLRCYELLQRNAMVRHRYAERFTHILVDEFQDTNVLQYKWLKTLAGYGMGSGREPGVYNSVFAVGDDDQSIYAFRGANVGNMTDFTRELGVEKIVRLEQNYRSSGHILKAANALIGNNEGRLGKNLWTDAGDGEKLRIKPCATGESEARFVAEEIDAEHMRGMKYSDFAVLYRSNAQSRALESLMMASGIPYRIYGGHRFFERAHVKDVLAYLRLVENPDDNTAFLRVVNVPARGIGAKTVENVQALAEKNGVSFMQAALLSGNAKLELFASLIASARRTVEKASLVEAVQEVLKRSTLSSYYEELDKKEKTSKADDLKEVVSAASAFLKGSEIDDDAPCLVPVSEDELSPLASFLALATLEAGDNQAGADDDAVQMMTVHAAKGLEFPFVFITGLEENLFPHMGAKRDDPEKGLEEERRLMYVAVTRAKKRLYLCFAGERLLNGQYQNQMQSSFIDEIPEEHVTWIGRKGSERISDFGTDAEGRYGATSRRGGYGSGYGSYGGSRYGSSGSGRSSSGVRNTDRGYSWTPGSAGSVKKDPQLAKIRKTSGAEWQAGQHVQHAKFGKGVVVNVVGTGDATKLQIAFEGAGVKQLLAKLAKLEKI